MDCRAQERKRVAVIGAGVSGLAAIKNCLEEGLEPVCFERHDQIGGLWYYSDGLREGQHGAIYRSVTVNSPKPLMAYSDFPQPREFPVFPCREQVYEYLSRYADHFELVKHIRFNTDVVRIDRSRDYASSGEWDVHFQGAEDDQVKVETFDGVLVCSGGIGDVYIPQIPGREEFPGVLLHSNRYREPAPFRGKRVIVVGASHTAGAIACELGRNYYDKVYLSMRNGTKVKPRLTTCGWPSAMIFTNRAFLTFLSHWSNWLLHRQLRGHIEDYERFGLESKFPNRPISYMINDDIRDSIAAGEVTIIPEIVELRKTDAILSDGTSLTDIDVIIFATGYLAKYRMLEDSWVFDDLGRGKLYKYMVPVDLEHPTLFIICAARFLPSLFPVVDMQSRWAARVLKKQVKLPGKTEMVRDMRRRQPLTEYSRETHCTLYMDDLARDIGVLPSFWKLLFTDPRLAYAFYFWPVVGQWYRLQGPSSWGGARKAILDVWEDTAYAFNHRYKRKTWRETISGKGYGTCAIAACGMAVVGTLYMRSYCP